ncbi:Protein mpe1 [Saitoella coloradoensis]
MSSAVYYQFKSQKEPSRISFDGTGISVFDLKREIITINKLGSGTDFDLAIYHANTNEEYKDDTTIIPRSTSVIARRLPASKFGKGTAARYVTGRAPTTSNSRVESFSNSKKPHPASSTSASAPSATTLSAVGVAASGNEEDMIKAMFAASSAQWNETLDQMSQQTAIHKARPGANNAPVPDRPPPVGYICYRCGEKGHWIQACPTNADPNYDGKPRVKRTTGIPRSFLKTVAKPLPGGDGDDTEEGKGGVMVNSEGEYVVAVADSKSWEKYQARATASTKTSDRPVSEELACKLCAKIAKAAVRFPCCKWLACEECAQEALLGSDFVCPNAACKTPEVLLEGLEVDEEIRGKVEEWIKEGEAQMSPSGTPKTENAVVNSKKRAAEDDVWRTPPKNPNRGRSIRPIA